MARQPPLAVLGLFLLAIVVTTGGGLDMPPDGHEAYVLQTTREMHGRGDWVVPYFNGAPRLNKPPLSYWLSGTVAGMTGEIADIQPWQGRVPSILGALLMLASTLLIGRCLFDRSTALLGGIVLATSAGYFAHAHDARPDMLYAGLCSAAFAAMTLGMLTTRERRPALRPALAMWLCLAMATLAKGPQVPIMLLLAAALLCGRDSLRVLHPVRGLALMTLLTLPWWWLLQNRLGGTQLEHSQLSGTLLTLDVRRFLDMYYLRAPLQLLLPWLVLIPSAVVCPFRRHEWRTAARWLAMPIVVAMTLFTLGPQHRWFYLLPLLPQMCLLLAVGMIRSLNTGWLSRLGDWLIPMHAVVILGAAVWIMTKPESPPGLRAGLAITVILCVVIALIARQRKWRSPAAIAAAIGVMVASLYANPVLTPILWSDERFDHARLAMAAVKAAGDSAPLAVLGLNPDVYAYYAASRPVVVMNSPAEAAILTAAAPGRRIVLILRSAEIASLPASLDVEVVDAMPGKPSAALSVLRLRPAARQSGVTG